MGKKGKKIGASTQEAIDDVVATPITSAFGGKAVILESFLGAVQALIDSEVEAVSPTLLSKIAWGAIKDGHSVIGGQEEDEEEPWTEDELAEMSAKGLRAEAKFFKVRLTKGVGGKSGRLNKKTKSALIDAILEAQNEYFGTEDDDEDDDEPYTKAELKDFKASELRDILDGWDVEYPKKAKAKALVKLVLSAQEEEEEDEEDEEDEEGEIELYTKADLKSYSLAELKEIAGEWELTVKKPTKKTLTKAILKFQTEELE